MKRVSLALAITAAACWLTGCQPAANTPANKANTNTNTAKPAPAAPTADALLAMEKQANEAYIKGDSKFFESMLSDKFVMSVPGAGRFDKATTVKMIAGVKCDVKSWDLAEPQMARIDNDTYVVSYKGTFDGSCTSEGKTEKLPSPVRAASVYVRSGEKWLAVYHGESPIVDPKAPPPPPAKADSKKKADPAKTDDKAAANANAASDVAPSGPTKSPNTDALVKLQTAGWEAFKNKDAKKLEELTTKDLSFVDPMGGWSSGQANVVKAWMDVKCEGITKVSFTDGFATALSPTVEVLTGKGTADGTCEGQKNGDLYQTAFYVKEGEAWKLAFMLESMPPPR